MPIRRERRWFYPIDWPQISAELRFRTPGPHGTARCWTCGRPHGHAVRCLPDGRWFDVEGHTWRDGAGREAAWPDIVEATRIRMTRVILAACHGDDPDPANCSRNNLWVWCQRCHILHDAALHRHQRRITYLLRRAVGDLFEGRYRYL